MSAWITAWSPGWAAQCHQAVGMVPHLRQWKKGLFLDFQLLSLNNSEPFTEEWLFLHDPKEPVPQTLRCWTTQVKDLASTLQNSPGSSDKKHHSSLTGRVTGHSRAAVAYAWCRQPGQHRHTFQASSWTPIRRASEINTDERAEEGREGERVIYIWLILHSSQMPEWDMVCTWGG